MHSLHSPSHPSSLRVITQSHLRTSYFPPQSPTTSGLHRSSSPVSTRSSQTLSGQPGSPLVSCLKSRAAHTANPPEGGYITTRNTPSHDMGVSGSPRLAQQQYYHRPSVSSYETYYHANPEIYTQTKRPKTPYFNDEYDQKTADPLLRPNRPAARRMSTCVRPSAMPLSPSTKYALISPIPDKPTPFRQSQLSYSPHLDPRRASHPPSPTVAAVAEGARRRPSFKIDLPPRPTPVDILDTEGSAVRSTSFIAGPRCESPKATQERGASTYTIPPAPDLYYPDPSKAPIFIEPFAHSTRPVQSHSHRQGSQDYIILHPDSLPIEQVGPKGERLHAHPGLSDRWAPHILDVPGGEVGG